MPYFNRALIFISLSTYILAWIIPEFVENYLLNSAGKFVYSYHFWTALTSTYVSYSLMSVLMTAMFLIQGSVIEQYQGTASFMLSFIFKALLANLLYVLMAALIALYNPLVYRTFFLGIFPIYIMYFTSDCAKHPWRPT